MTQGEVWLLKSVAHSISSQPERKGYLFEIVMRRHELKSMMATSCSSRLRVGFRREFRSQSVVPKNLSGNRFMP